MKYKKVIKEEKNYGFSNFLRNSFKILTLSGSFSQAAFRGCQNHPAKAACGKLNVALPDRFHISSPLYTVAGMLERDDFKKWFADYQPISEAGQYLTTVFQKRELTEEIREFTIRQSELEDGKIWIIKLMREVNFITTNSEGMRLVQRVLSNSMEKKSPMPGISGLKPAILLRQANINSQKL